MDADFNRSHNSNQHPKTELISLLRLIFIKPLKFLCCIGYGPCQDTDDKYFDYSCVNHILNFRVVTLGVCST